MLNGVEGIDVSREICEVDYAFYRTDHHWTTSAAYSAYLKASEYLGFTAVKNASFKTVTDEFNGTLYSKTLNDDIAYDSIAVYESDTDFELLVKDESHNSLYFEKFLKFAKFFCYNCRNNLTIA